MAILPASSGGVMGQYGIQARIVSEMNAQTAQKMRFRVKWIFYSSVSDLVSQTNQTEINFIARGFYCRDKRCMPLSMPMVCAT